MFNKILSEDIFQKSWSKGFIVPLHKSGNGRNPSYRGLTINSCLSQVFTSILNNRLQKYVHDNEIINKYKIGLTKKSQTSDHMLVLKTLPINIRLPMKKYILVSLISKRHMILYGETISYTILLANMGNYYDIVIRNYGTETSSCHLVHVCFSRFRNYKMCAKRKYLLTTR